MKQFTIALTVAAMAAATFACGEKKSDGDKPVVPAAAKDAAEKMDKMADKMADTMDKAADKLEATMKDEEIEVPEGLADLPAADRMDALAQKTCPVSGEPLGEMGVPVKKEVDGRVVFLCCKSCVKKFDADPKGYLAKIDAGGK